MGDAVRVENDRNGLITGTGSFVIVLQSAVLDAMLTGRLAVWLIPGVVPGNDGHAKLRVGKAVGFAVSVIMAF